MRRFSVLIIALLVAACATPREVCLSNASHDLNVVRSLIAASEATLRRGYAVETTTRYVTISQPCFSKKYPDRWCERTIPSTDRKAVAVDLAAEKQKLKSLRAKEKQLRLRTEQDIETCKIAHPE